jgi:dCTP diphosphatase
MICGQILQWLARQSVWRVGKTVAENAGLDEPSNRRYPVARGLFAAVTKEIVLMDELRDLLRDFAKERDWDQFHSPKNLAMALVVEAGEIVEHFQWLTEQQSQNLPPEKLREIQEEIGDTLIYLTRLADKLGIDPVEAARDKVRKNAEKYPVEKAKGRADKYTRL